MDVDHPDPGRPRRRPRSAGRRRTYADGVRGRDLPGDPAASGEAGCDGAAEEADGAAARGSDEMTRVFFTVAVAFVAVAWTAVGGQEPARLKPRPTTAVVGRDFSPAEEFSKTY